MRRAGATLPCGARASHCGGFSCCGARALGARASVVVARGLSGCGSQALECSELDFNYAHSADEDTEAQRS